MILLLSFIFILPFIFWQCLDFLKSSLYSKEYTFLKFILFLLILSLCIFNIFFFLILFPKIWFLFEKFNQSTDSTLSLKFLFELKVQDYLTFLFDFIYFSNLSLIFLLILYFFINYLGIENLIHWKKLFIFINIVFATLLSPPDISSQLFLLFFLTILFEIIIFIYIFIFKIDKYIKINKVTC
jgi:Sec-independent protein secretion pathway component TatC